MSLNDTVKILPLIMLCVYIKDIKTRHCDFIHFQGHKFEGKNHRFAIAGFSWSIVCNNNNYNYGAKNYYNFKPHYLEDRGDEYKNNGNFISAGEDYHRAIKCIKPPGLDHVFEDLWLAVNKGGTPNAIRFANRGMLRIAEGDWDQALKDFYLAIDADLYLADAYTHVSHDLYNEGIAELKNAVMLDISAAKSEPRELPKKKVTCDFTEYLSAFIDEQKTANTKRMFELKK